MSKKKKSEARDKRKKDKKARRETNKAKYAAMRDAGQNQKSKRFKLKARRVKRIRAVKHRLGPCVNVGCSKCSPSS